MLLFWKTLQKNNFWNVWFPNKIFFIYIWEEFEEYLRLQKIRSFSFQIQTFPGDEKRGEKTHQNMTSSVSYFGVYDYIYNDFEIHLWCVKNRLHLLPLLVSRSFWGQLCTFDSIPGYIKLSSFWPWISYVLNTLLSRYYWENPGKAGPSSALDCCKNTINGKSVRLHSDRRNALHGGVTYLFFLWKDDILMSLRCQMFIWWLQSDSIF